MLLRESDNVTQQPLPVWAQNLLHSLEIDTVNVDIDILQSIASTIKDDPNRDRLLIGFIAGYAAGLAEGSDMTTFDHAHAASVKFMYKIATME